jgi:hypothetical protein
MNTELSQNGNDNNESAELAGIVTTAIDLYRVSFNALDHGVNSQEYNTALQAEIDYHPTGQ